MQKNLVIVESPAKAKTIEKFLGKDYKVMSSYGHIRDLKTKEFSIDIEHDYAPQYVIPADKKKLVSELKSEAKSAEQVWLASDEDREGEAISWHLYEVLGLKPENTKRIVFHEITKNAILHAIETPRDININLVNAQQARRVLDRIVGFELSPVLWKKVKPALSAGRVQSVAVRLIVEREREISAFKPEAAYRVIGEFLLPGGELLKAELSQRLKTEDEAKAIAAACNKKQAVVSSLKKETKTVTPPKLYDLTTLQREANRYYGFTAQQTLDLVQSLYEKKLLTYPRTDSQFITEDMESTARQVIGIVSRKLPLFQRITHEPDIGRITNNAKVTDHHAIIPTVQLENQDLAELPESEQKIIRLVAMRLLSATGEKHIYDETSVTLTCEGFEFKAKGKTVVQDGWKSVERCFKETLKSKEKDEPERSLPSLNEKDILSSVDSSVTEHYTSPPKSYTEDSLLSAMETAGNAEFDDDTEKKGLGTPATRAGIIEKLVKGGFVERKGKSLVPTKDGNNLVCVLPEQITSPSMTAEWENTLMQIECGKADADKFLSGIVGMTSELVKAYPFLSDAEANRFDTGRESIGKCPRCGSPVYVGKGNYYCSNKECSFCMWEDNKFFTSKKKKLTKKIAAELLDKGWCRVTGLYTPKRPQLYDAVIRLDDAGGKYVSFKMEFDR